MKGSRVFSRTISLREAAAIIFALVAILPFLVVLAVLPPHEVLRKTEAQAGLLLAFLVALLGFVVLQLLVGQISKVAQTARGRKAVAPGTPPEQASVRAIPGLGQVAELEQIGRTFQGMLKDLRASTERLDDLVSKLGALSETVELTATIPKIQDLLALVLERTMGTVKALIGSVMLLDTETQTLRVVAARGLPEEAFAGPGVKLGDAIAGKVAQLGQPVLVDDIEKDPRFAKVNDPKYGHGSFISLPLRVEERVIGVINLAKKEYATLVPPTLRPFSVTDLQFLNTLMAHIAYALDNARLLQEARQSAARLEELLEELKMAQARLVEGETLRAMGQMTSGMAHHLNNLLAVVLGRIDLLLLKVKEPEIRHPLEIVRRAARSTAEVVGQVRRFTQVHPVSAEAVSVDLNHLIQDLMVMARPRYQDEAQMRGISIETTLELEPIPLVTGEAGPLREALMNLLVNAVDALPSGGKITIRTWASDQGVHVSVADTGVGMSEEVRRQALEPFFTTKGPKAAGLGLSAVHGIIQRHRGQLEIESEEGTGTVIKIRLPNITVPAKPGGDTKSLAPLTAVLSLRVLVIDDEAEVRETLAETLTAQGHTVVQAAGGPEGLAWLEAGGRADLVLTDLGMPEMTGWEVARSVKARWRYLPVGLITGWGEEPDASPEERSQVDFVITKPFTAESLNKAIRAAVHGQSLKG